MQHNLRWIQKSSGWAKKVLVWIQTYFEIDLGVEIIQFRWSYLDLEEIQNSLALREGLGTGARGVVLGPPSLRAFS